jgi:hypothetical protein
VSNNNIRHDPYGVGGSMYGSMQGGGLGNYSSIQDRTVATEISIGGETINATDIAKFKKLLGFMEFVMSSSPDMRNLMVAYEAKQRILK